MRAMFKKTMIAIVVIVIALFAGGYLYEVVLGHGGDAPVADPAPPDAE